MKIRSTIPTIIIALIVGAASFFGGIQYQKKQPITISGNMQNGQIRMMNGQGGMPGRGQGLAPVSGEILSLDESSLAIKMQDGSSKIVLLQDTTVIQKTTEAAMSDLAVGEQVTAFGTTNNDGSVTAQSIAVGNTMFGFTRKQSGQ